MSLNGPANTPPPQLPQIPNSMIGTPQIQGRNGTTGQKYNPDGTLAKDNPPTGTSQSQPNNNSLFQSQVLPNIFNSIKPGLGDSIKNVLNNINGGLK